MKKLMLAVVSVVVSFGLANAGQLEKTWNLGIGTLGEAEGVIKAAVAKTQSKYQLRWVVKEQRYVCKNQMGEVGYNAISIKELKLTRQGACTDLRGANLWNAYLSKADLRGANLRGADLRNANLWNAYLKWADLRGAYLNKADLRGADLKGAGLNKADLSNADLSWAYLGEADLRGADLRNADLSGAYLNQATYDDDTRLPFSENDARQRRMIKK